MVEVYNHGGGCCGVQHVQGFSAFYEEKSFPKERVDKCNSSSISSLDSIISGNRGWVGKAILAEVVLTEEQKAVHGNALLNRGFHIVSSFHNNNSGNNVYIFHKAPPPKKEGMAFLNKYKQLEELSQTPEVVGEWGG